MLTKLLHLDCALLLFLTPLVLPIENARQARAAEQVIIQNEFASEGSPGAPTSFLISGDYVVAWFSVPPEYDSLEIKEVQIGLDSIVRYPSPAMTFGELSAARVSLGEPGVPYGDYDEDGDVDMTDFGELQTCIGSNSGSCLIFDNDFNGVVDLADIQQFTECMSGPTVLADPKCGNFEADGITLRAPTPQSTHTNVDIELYCSSYDRVGFMGGKNLITGRLNQVPVIDVDPNSYPSMTKTGRKWIVNRNDGDFGIAVHYFWAMDPYATYLQETWVTEESGQVVVDTGGCSPWQNEVWLDMGTFLAGPYDLCDGIDIPEIDFYVDPSPGNLVIRVVGEASHSMAPFGDTDKDGDIDQVDFGVFQRCYSSSHFLSPDPECLSQFDCNHDGFIDAIDFEQFEACASGPAIPADPQCGHCFEPSLCEIALSQSPFIGVSDQLNRFVARHVLGLAESKAKDNQPFALPIIGWIFIILALIAIIYGIYDYYETSQIQSDLRKFRDAATCPNTQQQDLIKQAILLLRDNWANEDWSNPRKRSDPQAHLCGKELWDNEYWKCSENGMVLITANRGPSGQNQNPRNLVAVQPIGTNIIILSDDVFNGPSVVKRIATVLYSEWCHVWNKGSKERGGKYVSTEAECQRLLEAFQRRHGTWIEIHHGTNEGRPN